MKTRITVFDKATGTQLSWRRVDLETEAVEVAEDEDWIEGHVNDGTHYVDPETRLPAEKQTMPLVVGTNTITGIPQGTSAIVGVQRQADLIDDGELVLAVEWPATVRVTLQHPRFLTWIGEVACEPD